MAKKAKVKVKGVVLLEAFLALLLMAIASYGMAVGNSVQFSQMAAGRESDSAKNYAELEAEYLKSLGFDAVVTNNKDDDDPSRTPRYPDGEQSSVDKASNARDMTKFLGDTLGSEWRSTATLGKTINNINGDSDNKIQNIVVSVYKKSDGDNASPRATVTLPLSSQGTGDGLKDLYYKVHFTSESYSDGSSRTSITHYVALDLAIKTKSGYISIGEVTRQMDIQRSSHLSKRITYDGHTITWTGNVYFSNSALYIDEQYVGTLDGEYYFKM